MALSYSLIKSKPHLTTRTFLQWVCWHTMINVCITSFNNSPDYSHNHKVYKHCTSSNNVLSSIVGSEVPLNTFLLSPTSPNLCFALGFFIGFSFVLGGLLCFAFSVGKEIQITRIKMLNFEKYHSPLWNCDLGRKVSWNLILCR